MSNDLSSAEPKEADLLLLFADTAAQAARLSTSIHSPAILRPSSPSAEMARAGSVINLAAFREAKANDLDFNDKGLLRANRNIAAIGEVVTWNGLVRMTGLPIEEIKTRTARLVALGHIRYLTPTDDEDDDDEAQEPADIIEAIVKSINRARTRDALGLIVVKNREWVKAQSDELRAIATSAFARCKAKIIKAEVAAEKASKPKARK